jgi:hypothetical protein
MWPPWRHRFRRSGCCHACWPSAHEKYTLGVHTYCARRGKTHNADIGPDRCCFWPTVSGTLTTYGSARNRCGSRRRRSRVSKQLSASSRVAQHDTLQHSSDHTITAAKVKLEGARCVSTDQREELVTQQCAGPAQARLHILLAFPPDAGMRPSRNLRSAILSRVFATETCRCRFENISLEPCLLG